MKKFTQREQLILQAVVHTFITTAEPVGSRSIVRRYGLDLSPATVRNVMADLEEAGFLQQLHTSSGRVPTNRGYRYYVDYLMHVQELTLAERARIEDELKRRLNDADEMMRQTSHLLALVSHQTGIVEAPSEGEALIHNVELMAVPPRRLAVLVADSYGGVHTLMATLEESLGESELGALRLYLNDQLRGVAVERITDVLQKRLTEMMDERHRLAERALQLFEPIRTHRPAKVFLEGAAHLFEQPEFHDVDRAREVFNLLEERDRLVELLRQSMVGKSPGTTILIGSEAHGTGLKELSVVASPYFVHGKPAGMLGVLGPRRMPYSRLTAIVGYTAGMLGRFMTRLTGA